MNFSFVFIFSSCNSFLINPKFKPNESLKLSFPFSKLFEKILADSRKIAIDLAYVNDCTIDFIECLKKVSQTKKIGIFNIPSDIFVLFNTMKLDKEVELYVSELDFINSSHQLLNRNFSLVS